MPRGDGNTAQEAPYGTPRIRRPGPSKQLQPNPNASKRAQRRAERNGKASK